MLLCPPSPPAVGGAFTTVTGGGAGLLIPATVAGLGGVDLTVVGGGTGLANDSIACEWNVNTLIVLLLGDFNMPLVTVAEGGGGV